MLTKKYGEKVSKFQKTNEWYKSAKNNFCENENQNQ